MDTDTRPLTRYQIRTRARVAAAWAALVADAVANGRPAWQVADSGPLAHEHSLALRAQDRADAAPDAGPAVSW